MPVGYRFKAGWLLGGLLADDHVCEAAGAAMSDMCPLRQLAHRPGRCLAMLAHLLPYCMCAHRMTASCKRCKPCQLGAR